MKIIGLFAAVGLLCLTLAGCVISIPTELPEIEMQETMTTTTYYPLEVTCEDTETGVITLTEYSWEKKNGVLRHDAPVTATVYVDGQETDSYEVIFDDRGNFIRIGDTEITHTYNEQNRITQSVYSENGQVIKSASREYDENGWLKQETVCDGEGAVISRDTYTFEGEYGSYSTAEHYNADGAYTGFCMFSYNRGGALNTQQHYDADGNMVSFSKWLYFTSSVTELVSDETE